MVKKLVCGLFSHSVYTLNVNLDHFTLNMLVCWYLLKCVLMNCNSIHHTDNLACRLLSDLLAAKVFTSTLQVIACPSDRASCVDRGVCRRTETSQVLLACGRRCNDCRRTDLVALSHAQRDMAKDELNFRGALAKP